MMSKPSIGSRWHSLLTDEYVTVKDVQGDVIVLLDRDGNRRHTHVRDFTAEYRLKAQQRAVNL